MLLTANIEEKSIGSKHLFSGLKLHVEQGEKVAIIGRNGVGKTTLFRMLTGTDKDYAGSVTTQPGARVIATAQEHTDLGDITVLQYILHRLPEYLELKHIIDTYPEIMGDHLGKITRYSEALERFGVLDYYDVENRINQSLEDYQLHGKANAPMSSLSGGQKRFVELIAVEHADADLALIDEPTNHMDYVAKAAFLDWFGSVQRAVVVISHDRDVLMQVDRIIEIKNGGCQEFKGNYQAYLSLNASGAAAQMHDYATAQQTLENLHKQIQSVRAKKSSTSKTPNPFIPLEKRLLKQYAEVEAGMVEPNFWIDRESAAGLNKKVSDNYDKFKARNIRLHKTSSHEHAKELLRVEDLQLGYGVASEPPLFAPVNFQLHHGDRLRLIGRNGAGKTTLVRAIQAAAHEQRAATWRSGSIFCDRSLRMSVYEQEAGQELLDLPLSVAISHIYDSLGLPSSEETVMRTMGNYLFNPYDDAKTLVRDLSGGQKARLQIIQMLAPDPNLLILDEPTNHLDLPSIEELEDALRDYHGALLYISHDSYLAKNLGGSELMLRST
ncbi:MAG TPA: ABC-F family ATP-binding cassette domain-containing protein [Candidatus Saccharimonadales bacterium]|nr:ABC-F family ATP-binding cassette domain-containing protein [Candidatus Saccharimonadales bacterium]